ncbi:MAG: apolipoprotein N-acyltransferase [Alphaproteobacteria bacterium]|nr:apolipoprotein N-acyltransferase [Alphaproteobacteria bacterium]
MERLAGRIMLLWGPKRWLAAFLAGAVAVFSLPPFDFFAVLFVSFTILVWLLDGANGRPDAGVVRRHFPAFWTGWWFGFGYFVGGMWWLGNALLIEAADFAWALPFAVFGLPAVLAIFYGLAAALARALWSDGLGRVCALALGFGLAEWLRSFVLTGFPWNAIGYGAMPVPALMQSAGIIGLYGVSALAVFVFSTPALIATRRGAVAGLSIALILLLVHVGFGYWILSRTGSAGESGLVVRVVQPSVDQSKKWDDAERNRIFESLLSLSREPGEDDRPTHILWPETAVPYLLTSNPDALTRIGDALEEGQTLITGAVRQETAGASQPTRYYNSILVIDHTGQIIAAADKQHLVPFGEYLPMKSLFEGLGLGIIVNAPGSFTAGSRRQTVSVPGNKHFLPLICYEAIFPDGMAAAGPPADFIINVTNDAWYGATPGPYQHFRQAQVRAAETGLPLVRAANNGISAVTDGRGRVIDGLSQDVVGYIDVPLPGKIEKNRNIWRSEVFFWSIIALLLVGAVYSRYGFILRTQLT